MFLKWRELFQACRSDPDCHSFAKAVKGFEGEVEKGAEEVEDEVEEVVYWRLPPLHFIFGLKKIAEYLVENVEEAGKED
jgi:hypothetical protein